MSFGFQRGVSTHERHAHPVVRNMKRRETDPPTTSGRVWKEDEVALLRELDAIYRDHKFPNIEISKILTTKTADQIRSKRKTLKTVDIEGALQDSALETEGGCDLVESFMAFASQESLINNEEMVHEWQQCLIKEIEKQAEVPPILREMYARLSEFWDNGKRDKEALKDNLDKFLIEHL
jgi:hypothetical protein